MSAGTSSVAAIPLRWRASSAWSGQVPLPCLSAPRRYRPSRVTTGRAHACPRLDELVPVALTIVKRHPNHRLSRPGRLRVWLT